MKTKFTIAIADDHLLYRTGLSSLLKESGCHILCEAPHGLSLIQAIERAAQLPDLCLLDINMPVMDGIETARRLRERWPSIRLITLSMHDSIASNRELRKIGVEETFRKEEDFGRIQSAIFSTN